MKIVADESVDKPVVESLRRIGYEVDYILEESPGISDNEVLRRAFKKNAVLLTADKDFGELVFRLKQNHAGIVLYRLSGISNFQKSEMLINVFQKFEQRLDGNFTVVSKSRMRIVKLKR
ncbi:MAG: DUF5615 family PIN-like protein [Bacteroidales bacterium]|nr:DUF5615 family PIN-like protein [Bacteroidales bacterium]